MTHESQLADFLPRERQNNLWFRYNDSSSVVIFLHGIFSDSRSCWLHEDKQRAERSVYWPALVRGDPRFEDPSIYLAGFYTAVDAGPYEIRNCADEVYRALERTDSQGRLGPLTKSNVVFVCHSTGGIVARYLLEVNQASFVNKNIGLVMIASPSYGSRWASRLAWLQKLYNQQLGIQLQWGSWNLRDLDARFRDLVHQRRLPGLRGVEAYENHFIFHRRWLPDKRVVVTEESAGRYFGAPVLLRGTDHFTAVKPDSEHHPAHELLVDFWTKEIASLGDAEVPHTTTPSASSAPLNDERAEGPNVQSRPRRQEARPTELTETPPVKKNLDAAGMLNDGDRAREPSPPLTPLTSLRLFYDQWKDPSLTKLQKQRFERDHIGKKVHWDVRVFSVSEASQGRIHLTVIDGEISFDPPLALIVFSESDESALVDLKVNDPITVQGSIREFLLYPFIESSSISQEHRSPI